MLSVVRLCHCAKDWIVTANARSVFFVCRLGMANLVELGRRRQHTAAEPDGIALHVVRNHRHVNWFWLEIKK